MEIKIIYFFFIMPKYNKRMLVSITLEGLNIILVKGVELMTIMIVVIGVQNVRWGVRILRIYNDFKIKI
jgi:hypothetical protein